MKIAIGSDHAGFELKADIIALLKFTNHEVVDVGTNSTAPVDYPDYAEAVARQVLEKNVDRGIMICGSGIGASVAINKVPGIRGGICHDTYSAHQGVEHDNMNVLVMGSRVIGTALASDIVTIFLGAQFSNEERHVRRLAKVAQIEQHFLKEISSSGASK